LSTIELFNHTDNLLNNCKIAKDIIILLQNLPSLIFVLQVFPITVALHCYVNL